MLIRCHESGTGSVACSRLVILCQIRRKGGYKVIEKKKKKIHDNMKVDAPPTDAAPPAVLVQNYSTPMNLVACPVKHLASVQQFPHRPQLFLLVYTVKEARWRRSQEREGGVATVYLDRRVLTTGCWAGNQSLYWGCCINGRG